VFVTGEPLAQQPQDTTSEGTASGRALPFAHARLLALSAAFVYPAFWCARFASESLPSLLRLVWPGEELKIVRVSLYGSFLLSGPRDDPPVTPGFDLRTLTAETLLGIAVVVALAALVLYFSRRHNGLLCGLFVAMLGYTGFDRLLRRLWFQSPHAGWIAGAVVFAALWTLGLRRLIAATTRSGTGFGWRLAAALLGFTLPLALLWLALHWVVGMRMLRPFVWLFLPGLLPAVLASAPPLPAKSLQPQPIRWKWVAAGVAATTALAAVLAWAGPLIEGSFLRRRAAKARAMVEDLPQPSPSAPYPKWFFQRGINFTAEFGAPYASVDALQALDRLPKYGVNAVALVAFGFMRPGRPAVRIGRGLNVWESDEGMENLARLAHARGMKVFLKPQLWVRGGSPTKIDFRDPAERAEWFAQYEEFIDHYANLATRIHADLFAVGVELAGLSRYNAEWRKIIAGVRRIYPGPLVYAANFGRDFQDVEFWDDLDYIGLDEYYPLPTDLSTKALVRRVKRVELEYRKPVLFTEVGFPSLEDAQRAPWNDSPRAISLEDQARCYQAIFQAFYTKPWFAGMYWWKVGTSGRGGPGDGSFTPWGKPAMKVLRKWYTNGAH
jgi:hypothetical protein